MEFGFGPQPCIFQCAPPVILLRPDASDGLIPMEEETVVERTKQEAQGAVRRKGDGPPTPLRAAEIEWLLDGT